jgi:predicted GNAT family acetyltransferase
MAQYTDKNGTAVTVDHDDALTAFVVREENGEYAGKAAFRDREDARIFFHTEVDERFGGRGLGTALVRGALEATRAEGVVIVPVCPLVKAFLDKNGDEFAGAWRKPSPDDLAAVRAGGGS